jgi:hypothetical protein
LEYVLFYIQIIKIDNKKCVYFACTSEINLVLKGPIAKKERSKKYHDRNVNVPLFIVGDKVLLHDEKVRRGRSLKLTPPWMGPYLVTEVDDVNITLKLPKNRTLKVHGD